MRRTAIPAFALALALAAGACGEGETVGPVPIEETDFAPELGVSLDAMTRTASGLYYQDLAVGTGDTARAGREVSAHYTGRLADGTEFDSSAGGDPISFTLGVGQVIPGWDEGLDGMLVGGKRKLVIPHHLAYGASGIGPIPPYATLVFDVELVDVVVPEE